MPSATEGVRLATLPLVHAPHPRADDEDMHPARLDPAEAALERALAAMEDAKKETARKR